MNSISAFVHLAPALAEHLSRGLEHLERLPRVRVIQQQDPRRPFAAPVAGHVRHRTSFIERLLYRWPAEHHTSAMLEHLGIRLDHVTDKVSVDLSGPAQTMLTTLYLKALDADFDRPVLGDQIRQGSGRPTRLRLAASSG